MKKIRRRPASLNLPDASHPQPARALRYIPTHSPNLHNTPLYHPHNQPPTNQNQHNKMA